jgi:hypothetical protein
VKFLLSDAYRGMQEYGRAIEALSGVFRFARDPLLKKRADLALAGLQEKEGRPQDAYASYLRVALHPEPRQSPGLVPLVRQGLLRALDLGLSLASYDDVLYLCDKYLDLFPQDDAVESVREKRRQASLEKARQEALAGVGEPGPLE